MTVTEQPIVPPYGSVVRVDDYDPSYSGISNRKDAESETRRLLERLGELQLRLFAEKQKSVLLIFQSMNAGGKDAVIRKLFVKVHPQGIKIVNFQRPTPQELQYDFLWRVHAQVPPKGYVGVFNRGHYEDVLVARVNRLAPPDIIDRRYEHINHFERMLADSGTRILKFYLHMSKAEQKERFLTRLHNPNRNWKFSAGDLLVRKRWDEYMTAFGHVLTRCHTPYAPWHIVPSNEPWYRDLIVTRAVVDLLERMNPRFPPPDTNPYAVVIPD